MNGFLGKILIDEFLKSYIYFKNIYWTEQIYIDESCRKHSLIDSKYTL